MNMQTNLVVGEQFCGGYYVGLMGDYHLVIAPKDIGEHYLSWEFARHFIREDLNNWDMPTIDELSFCYERLISNPVNMFTSGGSEEFVPESYWSKSKNDRNTVHCLRFDNGNRIIDTKNHFARSRAVKRIPVAIQQ